MSAARMALSALVDLLAAAIAPEPVVVDDDGAPDEDAAVVVRVGSLDRIGRSRREGSLLDLLLVAQVTATGAHALERVECLLAAVERSTYTAGALDPRDASALPPGALAFLVRVPVAVPFIEPTAPLVTEPPVVRVNTVSTIHGRVVGADGRGVTGALVRSRATGVTTSTDDRGAFALLTTDTPDADSRLVVEIGGRRRIFAASDDVPFVLRWDSSQPDPSTEATSG